MATILPPAFVPPSITTDPQAARAWKAAQDFEAMALGELLKPMFDTVDLSQTPFGGGDGEATWQPMLVTEIAKRIAAGGGLGLAEPIYQQMLRMQEDADSQRLTVKPAAPRHTRKDAMP
jgi:Rod binding domain-containing protein